MSTGYVWILLLCLAAWGVAKLVERGRAQRVKQLLSEVDDKKLRFGVLERICKTRDDDGSAAAWPEHERVVALALETSAIIGNGGFSFLSDRTWK